MATPQRSLPHPGDQRAGGASYLGRGPFCSPAKAGDVISSATEIEPSTLNAASRQTTNFFMSPSNAPQSGGTIIPAIAARNWLNRRTYRSLLVARPSAGLRAKKPSGRNITDSFLLDIS